MKRVRLLAICICFCSSLLSDPITLAQKKTVAPIAGQTLKGTDVIGFSPVELHDLEGRKIGPFAFPWKAGKFDRGYTTVQEFLFRAPKGTRFKTFQAEDLQLDIEKLEGRGSN